MVTDIIPKLPMRHKETTRAYYVDQLGFTEWGRSDYPEYLMVEKDGLQLHFFSFPDLVPLSNYGQVYIRCNDIDTVYEKLISRGVPIHPNGDLTLKPWGQKEFSLLDPDHNLLTFGQTI